jgi:hypothetical protein
VGEEEARRPVGRGVREVTRWVGVEERAGEAVLVFVEVEEGVGGRVAREEGDLLAEPVAGYVTRALRVATVAVGLPVPAPPAATPQGVPVMGEEEGVLLRCPEDVEEEVFEPVEVFELDREAVAVEVGRATASACLRSRFTRRSPMRSRAAYKAPPRRVLGIVAVLAVSFEGNSPVRFERGEPSSTSKPTSESCGETHWKEHSNKARRREGIRRGEEREGDLALGCSKNLNRSLVVSCLLSSHLIRDQRLP